VIIWHGRSGGSTSSWNRSDSSGSSSCRGRCDGSGSSSEHIIPLFYLSRKTSPASGGGSRVVVVVVVVEGFEVRRG